MLKKIKRYLREPRFALGCDLISRHPDWMSDRFWVETNYRLQFGQKLDLQNPKSFNEKLQWLKLYDRNPLYPALVDKITVKDWVAARIGEEHIIPTTKVFNSVDDIDLEYLPDRFVLKCNHDSGGCVVCSDKSEFDLPTAKHRLRESLVKNFFYETREWPYKSIRPKVFAEEFLGTDLADYKFFTFDGKVKALFVATGRMDPDRETSFDFYDEDFHHLKVKNGHPNAIIPPKKPERFEEMKRIAEILGKGFPHVRVDLYETSGQIFFGEMTFYHFGGMVPFNPPEFDLLLGSFLRLPFSSR